MTNLFVSWKKRLSPEDLQAGAVSARCVKSSMEVPSVILSKFITKATLEDQGYKNRENLANAITLASANEPLLSAVCAVHPAAGTVVGGAVRRGCWRLCAALPPECRCPVRRAADRACAARWAGPGLQRRRRYWHSVQRNELWRCRNRSYLYLLLLSRTHSIGIPPFKDSIEVLKKQDLIMSQEKMWTHSYTIILTLFIFTYLC